MCGVPRRSTLTLTEATPADLRGWFRRLAKGDAVEPNRSTYLLSATRRALSELNIRCFHWELAFPESFFLGNGRRGFDVVIGNPPYDVLAERELGPRTAFSRHSSITMTALRHVVGKNNLYKLFICRAVELTRYGGYVSFIVPMPLLGDEQARGIAPDAPSRRSLSRSFIPEKGLIRRDAFFGTLNCQRAFCLSKASNAGRRICSVPLTRHRANTIDIDSPSLSVRTSEIPLYDPTNVTIRKLFAARLGSGGEDRAKPGIRRLGSICKSYQGEVNETTDRAYVSRDPVEGRRLVLRGANVCMYVLREASQGVPLYLDVNTYQKEKANSATAFHSRVERVGFQRSAPQNNYRRVIAAHVPAGEFLLSIP